MCIKMWHSQNYFSSAHGKLKSWIKDAHILAKFHKSFQAACKTIFLSSRLRYTYMQLSCVESPAMLARNDRYNGADTKTNRRNYWGSNMTIVTFVFSCVLDSQIHALSTHPEYWYSNLDMYINCRGSIVGSGFYLVGAGWSYKSKIDYHQLSLEVPCSCCVFN